MNIPQSELDKLSNEEPAFTDIEEQEEVVEQPVKIEEKVSVSPDEDTVADKARIPYSRFEKVNERAIRAEERLKLLEEQQQSQTESTEPEVDQEWLELYGDTDVAKKAQQLNNRYLERLQERAIDKVYERIQLTKKEEQEMVKKNLEDIEESLAEFQEKLGRKLSEDEESSILDIQDEFAVKDENGNYLSPLLAPEKAYEVFTLRQQGAKSGKSDARKRVLSVTSTSSDSDGSSSAFENYKPGVSGLWRNAL